MEDFLHKVFDNHLLWIENVEKKQEYPADYPEEYKAYDAKSKEAWSKFNPIFYQGEQSIMAVTYLGVTAGYITIMSKERRRNLGLFATLPWCVGDAP